MKKSRKKASETPASHNGIYRIDEMAKAFGIPKSRLYFWSIQEKLVPPDYHGRSKRPSLYMEKSAALLLMIEKMLAEGIRMPDIKAFLKRNHIVLYRDYLSESDAVILHRGSISHTIYVGAIRKDAKKMLKEYLNGLQEKPRTESSSVQAHPQQPVKAADGLASV